MAANKVASSSSSVQVLPIGLLPAIKKRIRDKKGQNTAFARAFRAVVDEQGGQPHE